MQKWQKAIRLFGLALLIVLAVTGIGLSGAATAFQTRRRPADPEIKIELVEPQKKEDKTLKKLSLERQ